MAAVDESKVITKAFSGLGIDEKSLISILGKWNPDQRKSFRKGTREFFKEDERQFERWSDQHVLQLRQEFLRLKDAIVLWTMHPWERDARIFKEALTSKPRLDLLIETACTRSSDELLGARRAYHSLFERSIEEDIATYILGSERKLLIALVSAYRYEGPIVNEETAKAEAKTIFNNAIKHAAKKKPVEDEDVVWILSTRSKLHINAIYKHYKEIGGKNLDEDLEGHSVLKQTVQCLTVPQTYFSQILHASIRNDVDEPARDSVTRVIVSRADVDMKQIKEEFQRKNGISLPNKIEEVAHGNYKDFLLTLIARGD